MRSVTLALAVAVLTMVFACDMFEPSNVVYGADGSADAAQVTVQLSGGVTEQHYVSPVDWAMSRECSSGEKLYISATNMTTTGEVVVEITVDGDSLDKSSGYSTATASATCP